MSCGTSPQHRRHGPLSLSPHLLPALHRNCNHLHEPRSHHTYCNTSYVFFSRHYRPVSPFTATKYCPLSRSLLARSSSLLQLQSRQQHKDNMHHPAYTLPPLALSYSLYLQRYCIANFLSRRLLAPYLLSTATAAKYHLQQQQQHHHYYYNYYYYSHYCYYYNYWYYTTALSLSPSQSTGTSLSLLPLTQHQQRHHHRHRHKDSTHPNRIYPLPLSLRSYSPNCSELRRITTPLSLALYSPTGAAMSHNEVPNPPHSTPRPVSQAAAYAPEP